MEHGKHVLCEKPMGVNSKEVKAMIAASRKHQVFLMEALWSRFNPTICKVKTLIEEDVIGAVKYIHADFVFNAMDRDENSRLLNPELAGGSLLDIGIYPIFLAYLILGKPEIINANSTFHTNGVEVQTAMLFNYNNAHAVLYSGLTSKSEGKAMITGTKGSLFIHPRWHESHSFTLVKGEEEEHIKLPPNGKGYTHEIIEAHNCIQANTIESSLWSHQNSMDLITLLDSVREQTGITFPFET